MGVRPWAGAGLVLVLTLSLPAPAGADGDQGWLLAAELPGAVPLGAPQNDWFGPGGMPAAALYWSLSPRFLVGGKLRAGGLSDGDPPGGGLMDPGNGGLLSLGAGVRLRPAPSPAARRGAGPWLELFASTALTGDLVRPTFEIGAGWGFPLGPVNIGPSVRYLPVLQRSNNLDGRDAKLALFGIEVSLLDRRPPRREAPPPPPPVAAPAPQPAGDRDHDGILDPDDKCPDQPEDIDGFADDDGCPDPDNDGDHILDVDDKCPLEPEVVNGIDDDDGCPDRGLFVVVEDRIVLEERILFDSGRARVKHGGKKVLAAINAFWRQHPEYVRVVIEGHADNRGSDRYNQWLSEERARRVKRAMEAAGADGSKIETVGYGETKPRVPNDSHAGREKNRRVEFVMIREHQELQAAPPAAGAPAGGGRTP